LCETLLKVDFSRCTLSTHQNFSPIWLISLLSIYALFQEVITYFIWKGWEREKRKKERKKECATLEESRLLFRKLLLFQALLRGALTQQSAVILVCMAIDRYVCMLHPHRYHKHSSKRVRLFCCLYSLSN